LRGNDNDEKNDNLGQQAATEDDERITVSARRG
jgi:hypothetical protein